MLHRSTARMCLSLRASLKRAWLQSLRADDVDACCLIGEAGGGAEGGSPSNADAEH